MNVAKQRRKILHAITDAPDAEHASDPSICWHCSTPAVAAEQPQLASQFLPMYEEEFQDQARRPALSRPRIPVAELVDGLAGGVDGDDR